MTKQGLSLTNSALSCRKASVCLCFIYFQSIFNWEQDCKTNSPKAFPVKMLVFFSAASFIHSISLQSFLQTFRGAILGSDPPQSSFKLLQFMTEPGQLVLPLNNQTFFIASHLYQPFFHTPLYSTPSMTIVQYQLQTPPWTIQIIGAWQQPLRGSFQKKRKDGEEKQKQADVCLPYLHSIGCIVHCLGLVFKNGTVLGRHSYENTVGQKTYPFSFQSSPS